jgi:uncharacterized membrane protein YbhN (UPF0104 family)
VALPVVVVLAVRGKATLMLALQAVTHASRPWAFLVVSAMLVSFSATGTGLAAASGGAISSVRAGLVEVAGAFCNRFGPGSVGGTLLRVRVLTCAGLPVARAVAAVTVIGTIGAVTQALGITIAALTTPHPGTVAAPGSVAMLLAMTGVALLAAAWLLRRGWPRWVPRRLASTVRMLAMQLRVLVGHVHRLARDRWTILRILAASSVAVTARVLAFWGAAHAVGLGLSVASAMLVYLAGMALANAAPVPGGVGPAELALSAGLVTVGAPAGSALGAVLIFRLASFWLPSVIGAGALVWLCGRGALRRQVQTGDMLPIGPGTQSGPRAADKPWPNLCKGARAMPVKLAQRLNGLGTVQKVLLAGTAATAAALIGTGAAYAATPSSPAAPSTTQSQESTSAPDTDSVQSGDQTGPDTTVGKPAAGVIATTAVDKLTAGDTADTTVDKPTAGDTADKPGAADTDTVQSGDQTGPDTGGADTGGTDTAG